MIPLLLALAPGLLVVLSSVGRVKQGDKKSPVVYKWNSSQV